VTDARKDPARIYGLADLARVGTPMRA